MRQVRGIAHISRKYSKSKWLRSLVLPTASSTGRLAYVQWSASESRISVLASSQAPLVPLSAAFQRPENCFQTDITKILHYCFSECVTGAQMSGSLRGSKRSLLNTNRNCHQQTTCTHRSFFPSSHMSKNTPSPPVPPSSSPPSAAAGSCFVRRAATHASRVERLKQIPG